MASPRARIAGLTCTALVLAAASATAGIALADTPARAPYAQAAAHVDAEGNLVRSKNIAEVTRPGTGITCVRVAVSSPPIDVQRAIPVASLLNEGDARWGGQLLVTARPTSWCDEQPDTITVRTADIHETMFNLPFSVIIP